MQTYFYSDNFIKGRKKCSEIHFLTSTSRRTASSRIFNAVNNKINENKHSKGFHNKRIFFEAIDSEKLSTRGKFTKNVRKRGALDNILFFKFTKKIRTLRTSA